MWRADSAAARRVRANPAVRVVVFAGAGDKAFVSGADISQFESERANREANDLYTAQSAAATRAMALLEKPSIAMIRGFCIGGGLAVALTCDLRIAAEDTLRNPGSAARARLRIRAGARRVEDFGVPHTRARFCSLHASSTQPTPGAVAWSIAWCQWRSSNPRCAPAPPDQRQRAAHDPRRQARDPGSAQGRRAAEARSTRGRSRRLLRQRRLRRRAARLPRKAQACVHRRVSPDLRASLVRAESARRSVALIPPSRTPDECRNSGSVFSPRPGPPIRRAPRIGAV